MEREGVGVPAFPRAGEVPPEPYGDLGTADHMTGGAWSGDEPEGMGDANYAICIIDVATNCRWISPTANKSAARATEALHHFWGPRGIPKLF